MEKNGYKRVVSLVLAFSVCAGVIPPAGASGTEETPLSFQKVDNDVIASSLLEEREVAEDISDSGYDIADRVRVSIVLEGSPAICTTSDVTSFATDTRAVSYRKNLKQMQLDAAEEISSVIGEELDVIWNLTLAANIISAEVNYGDIEAIEKIEGITDVFIENRYEPCVTTTETAGPNMATSGDMIGSGAVWAEGYTGAGSLIAIIDTGTDIDHQSFDAGAFEHAIQQVRAEGKEVDLLEVQDIADKLAQLNIYQKDDSLTAEDLYLTSKLPFAYNYIDEDLDVTHLNDTEGEHGSHVAGIATANRYIPNGNGGYVNALETVSVQGVAPDAQLMTMKVFGKGGGAYDSDYMVAIEDAIVLGADSINLSLGSGSAGMTYHTVYQDLLNNLTAQGAVINISAGNAGTWQENTYWGYLYSDDVNMQTDGSPGSYTNALTVASVDNAGKTAQALKFSSVDSDIYFAESNDGNEAIIKLDTSGNGTEYGFVLFDNIGATEEGENLLADYADVTRNKVVMVWRGDSDFSQKHEAAEEVDAVACIVMNNVSNGTVEMDLSKSTATIPCVGISQADGNAIKNAASAVRGTDGSVLYYTGTVTITREMNVVSGGKVYTMSYFSSWGVPSSLELKPEITAPGGGIYSVFGTNKNENGVIVGGTDQYENMSGTSMAAPQVSGMAAIFAQFYRENGLAEKTGVGQRTLSQSLLMSTATPLVEKESGSYYAVFSQGAGLANVDHAIHAHSYIMMDEKANAGAKDGKVKVELGDDPEKTGVYSFAYTLHNLLDEPAYYELETDVFTQDVFSSNRMKFLDTWTTELENAVVTYKVDGEPLADQGVYSAINAQTILDALAEGATENLIDKYDLDGDGEVTTYDAHLILAGTEPQELVCVPANGSVTVSVTIDVTGSDLSDYPNGTYIEAYSYAKEHTAEEGVAGTIHSIPVLGFYGNWSAPSMYDVGTLAEYRYGIETRPPYLYEMTNCNTNIPTVKYAGDGAEYYYYGNPVAYDKEYLEERNAFNSNDTLYAYYFTQIRNAGAAKILIRDANDMDKVYYDSEDRGQSYGAYYSYSSEKWIYSLGKYSFKWKGTDDKGNKLPEDTEVEISLILAPEYYVTYTSENGTLKKTVDWEALGEGAYLTTRTAIDNTAPSLISASYSKENKTLTVTAKDNRYLAYVALYKQEQETAQKIEAAVPNQEIEKKGTEFTTEFDVSKLQEGDNLYIQIIDYAMNLTTYKLTLGGDGKLQAPSSITMQPEALTLYRGASSKLNLSFTPWVVDERVKWETSDPDVATVDQNGVVTALENGKATITVTSEADGAVSATCEVTVRTRDVTVFGVLQDENADIRMFSWNMDTEKKWEQGTQVLAEYPDANLTSATSSNTMIYLMDDDEYMYEIDPDAEKTVGKSSNVFGYLVDDMEWGYANSVTLDTDVLFGVYGKYVLIVAPENEEIGYVLNLETNFVTIAYGGDVSYDTGCFADVFYCLTTSGKICVLQVDILNEKVWRGFVETDLDLNFSEYNCSMIVGSAEELYLSYYNPGEECSEIYLLEYDKESKNYVSAWLGSMGQGVWPCALLMVTENQPDSASVVSLETETAFPDMDLVELGSETFLKTREISKEISPSGSLTATVEKGETADTEEGRKTVSLYISVDSSTNGLIELTYDKSALTFERATGMVDMLRSVCDKDGTLRVAYASRETISGDVFTLTFSYDGATCPYNTNVQVATLEEAKDFAPEETYDLPLSLRTPPATGNSGGGSSSDTVTVPSFAGTGSVNVKATISKGTAVINISDRQLEKLLADGGETVTIDISALKNVNAVKLPAAVIDTLCERKASGLVVILPDGVVTLDATALESINGGKTVTISVKPATYEKLTDVEKTAVTDGGAEVVTAVDVEILVGGVAIRDFNGGKVTISIPYVSAEEDEVDELAVWFIRDDGTVEELGGWYEEENACFVFETSHLSRYLLVKAETHIEFLDVPSESWYTAAVIWATKNGVTGGVGDDLFAPKRVCTRSEVVTFLWRLAGEPKPESVEEPFVDVNAEDFYHEAMLWAVENGITGGVGDGFFAPERICTRSEIVTLLWRLAGKPELEFNEMPFTDVEPGDFYYEAVLWATENGISGGIGNDLFGTENSCTRAEVVTFLYRLYGV